MFDGAFAGSLECGLMDDDGCKMQTWLDKSENGPLYFETMEKEPRWLQRRRLPRLVFHSVSHIHQPLTNWPMNNLFQPHLLTAFTIVAFINY